MTCDLHAHSTASDGTVAPEAWGDLAARAGVDVVALTDHDTTDGLPAAAASCLDAGVRFIPGIEISVDSRVGDPQHPDAPPSPRIGTLHILGLGVRHDAPGLLAIRDAIRIARGERNPRIVERLNALGMTIDYDEVQANARAQGGSVIGRPHIAQALVERGYAASIVDAFNRFIGEGRPAYVRRDLLPAHEAIEAIHEAGGLAVLAHPVQMKAADRDAEARIVRRLAAMGLDGIEVNHPDHSPEDAACYETLAERLDLLKTGGSDFHGSRKPIALNQQRVPVAWAHALLARLTPA